MDKNKKIIAKSNFGRKMYFLKKEEQSIFISVDNIKQELSIFLKFCVSEKWIFEDDFIKRYL